MYFNNCAKVHLCVSYRHNKTTENTERRWKHDNI
nr:MAG TPA: hypothetical protein [Bacteriophage sp.]